MFGQQWADGQQGDNWHAVVALLSQAVSEGRLRAYFLSVFYHEIERVNWARCDPATVLASGKFRWLRTDHWVYFDEVGVRALLFQLHQQRQSSATFSFDMTARRWHLFDVAIWIATGGAPTTTAAIARENLEDEGCRQLFDKLSSLTEFGSPEISGLSPMSEMRVPLPSSYLERAHTGWLGEGAGHLVRFYESANPSDPGGPGIIVADITLKNHRSSFLVELSMLREEVLTLFPQRDPAPVTTASSWQPQIDQMLRLLNESSSSITAKGAARQVCPDKSEALYRAFRKQHPEMLRAYYRDDVTFP